MSVKNLVQTWSLPDRTQDRQQLTLRLNYDLYAKLHALKEIYKTRSVNDMINDVLTAGLDEIIQALPSYPISDEDAVDLAHYQGGRPEDYLSVRTGPRIFFDSSYRKILEQKDELKSQEEVA
jgi:hypothetical protein